MRKVCIAPLAALLLLGCFAGCARQAEEPAPTAKLSQAVTVEDNVVILPSTPEPEVEAEPDPEPIAGPVNPLTGEPVSEDISANRPFFVMVSDSIEAQPQRGISQADMIWELMEEGGITRMMAFFTDLASVDVVGSIRSARYYNVNITQAYDAIIVHAGGSGEALDYIAWGIDDLDDNGNTKADGVSFFRDPTRRAHGWEHSLFAHGSGLVAAAEEKGYRAAHADGYDGYYGLSFSESAADQCSEPANYISVKYAGGKTTNFTYDAATDTYTGEQYGSAYSDNGEIPVHFKNVIVMNADTKLQEDGMHLTIDLLGSGSGFFACGGKYVRIQWQRADDDDCFHFSTLDGQPLSLGVGKTFVAVQQVGSYSGTTEFMA